jgi:hypothetical protein
MPALDDVAAWSNLTHVYGSAADTPKALAMLTTFPPEGKSGPWFELWSSLCHQDSAFEASFAAVPHIVAALSSNPSRATLSFFALPVCIELARAREGKEVPSSLQPAYIEALRALGTLSQESDSQRWDEYTRRAASAALAISVADHSAASAIIDPDEDE